MKKNNLYILFAKNNLTCFATKFSTKKQISTEYFIR